jgi:hypothetical protein
VAPTGSGRWWFVNEQRALWRLLSMEGVKYHLLDDPSQELVEDGGLLKLMLSMDWHGWIRAILGYLRNPITGRTLDMRQVTGRPFRETYDSNLFI